MLISKCRWKQIIEFAEDIINIDQGKVIKEFVQRHFACFYRKHNFVVCVAWILNQQEFSNVKNAPLERESITCCEFFTKLLAMPMSGRKNLSLLQQSH